MATVLFTPQAQKQAGALPRRIRARLLAVVERLEDWPDVSGAKPLSGNLAGFYRIRTGDYRLQFRIEGDKVIVVKVGHRDRFYED
jgi:mRNA interferase RelE/StbE